MKRSPLLRKPDDKAHLSVPIKRRKCKVCREPFITTQGMRNWCSPDCGAELAEQKLAKQTKAAAVVDRAKTRTALEAIKTLPMLKAEAQKAVNAFVRARDVLAGHGCICCGEPLVQSDGVRSHNIDAGHYRSVGSAPHLRFDLRNIHAQRVVCNRHGAGRAVDYRIGLIARIGMAAVEALEADQTPRKYTRDELRAIRDVYRAKVRIMKKEMQ